MSNEQKRKRAIPEDKTVATLELEVSYEDLPDSDDIDQVLEKARELGGIERATFTIHRTIKKELV